MPVFILAILLSLSWLIDLGIILNKTLADEWECRLNIRFNRAPIYFPFALR